MLISKEMYLFLKDYLKWIDNGADDKKPYYRWVGLCGSILGCKIPDLNLREIRTELGNLFKSEGLDVDYPFGKESFDARHQTETQHEDPIRLKWIKDHIKEYENTLASV